MMILSQVCEIRDTRYPADPWIDSGWGGWVNVWVGALSTIPREHLRVIVGGCVGGWVGGVGWGGWLNEWVDFQNKSGRLHWVGALSTIPREHLRVIVVGWLGGWVGLGGTGG